MKINKEHFQMDNKIIYVMCSRTMMPGLQSSDCIGRTWTGVKLGGETVGLCMPQGKAAFPSLCGFTC